MLAQGAVVGTALVAVPTGATAVGISGIAWSQRFEQFKGRPFNKSEPAAMPYQSIPAVGISGIPWSERLDFAIPRKGHTDPQAIILSGVPAVGVSGIPWSQRFEVFYGRPIKFGIPQGFAHRGVPAVGLSGVAWSQRFEPFYSKPIRLDIPPAYDAQQGPAEPSGMAWFTNHDIWRSLRPFDFTSPIGATFVPIWIATPPAEFTGERRPLYLRGVSYWKGRS